MTDPLPGGGVPRVHRARSPLAPRLPHFSTPRSVRYLRTLLQALCRHRNAWLPGVPALPGPCYWLAASGLPMGWRGGCIAAGLVRNDLIHYRLGVCSALFVCARRSQQVRGVERCRFSYPPPLVSPFSRATRGACCGLSCPLSRSFACWYGIPRGLQARSGCPQRPCPVPVACACVRPLEVYALSPLVGVVLAPRYACRALVRSFHAVSAPPRVLSWSRAPRI